MSLLSVVCRWHLQRFRKGVTGSRPHPLSRGCACWHRKCWIPSSRGLRWSLCCAGGLVPFGLVHLCRSLEALYCLAAAFRCVVFYSCQACCSFTGVPSHLLMLIGVGMSYLSGRGSFLWHMSLSSRIQVSSYDMQHFGLLWCSVY